MTEAQWQQLCELLDLAIEDQRVRDKERADDDLTGAADWYVLMGARRLSFGRHFTARYPGVAA